MNMTWGKIREQKQDPVVAQGRLKTSYEKVSFILEFGKNSFTVVQKFLMNLTRFFFLILPNLPIVRVIRLASWECLPRGYKEQTNNITVNSAIFTALMFLSVLHVCFIFVPTYSVGCCHFTDKEIMNH